MKFCLIGQTGPEEIQRIKKEILNRGYTCIIVPPQFIEAGIKEKTFEIKYKETDLKEFDIFLIRTSNAGHISQLCNDPTKLIYEFDPNRRPLDKFTQAIKLAYNGILTPTTKWLGKYDVNSRHSQERFALIEEVIKNFPSPFILKTVTGSKGNRVFKYNVYEEAVSIMKEYSTKDFIIQEFIGNREDIRVIVLNGEVLGAMSRKAKEGEFRTNFSQGGEVENYSLTEELKSIALKTAKTLGINFGGIDIMFYNNIPYVLEANRVPQFKAFEEVSGIDVSKKLVDLLIEKYRSLPL